MSYEEKKELAEKTIKKEFGNLTVFESMTELQKQFMYNAFVTGFLKGESNMIERYSKLMG